jgi:hypothetical protein
MPIGVKPPIEDNEVSIISVSMNRHTSLIASLHLWIFLPVKEIVLIDWCSHTKLSLIIPSYLKDLEEFKKVRIIRVSGTDAFYSNRAYNLATNLSSSSFILKANDDTQIDAGQILNNSVRRVSAPLNLQQLSDDEFFVSDTEPVEICRKEHIFLEENIFVLKVQYGLGNRLRALLTACEFCEKYNYRLYVVWSETAGFDNTKFDELFTLPYDITFINSDTCSLKFDLVILKDDVKTQPIIFLPKIHKKIYLESGNYIFCEFSTGLHFTGLYYIKAKPSMYIETMVKYIHTNIIKGKYNIFQIRRGDTLSSEYVSHFRLSSIYMYAKFINASDLINVVISDDYQYCKRFLDVLCPNKYIVINANNLNKSKTVHETKHGVNMDAVDFCLFRDATTIYANNFSSFSFVASHVFNKQLVVVKDPNKFYLLRNDPTNIVLENYLPFVTDYVEHEPTLVNDSMSEHDFEAQMIYKIYDKFYRSL